jgi:hypothetical protein
VTEEVMVRFPKVDFKQFKHGEENFFLGHRTIHPEEEIPRVRLREYQRKVFYEEPDEEAEKLRELTSFERKGSLPKPKQMEIPMGEETPPLIIPAKDEELQPKPEEGVPQVAGGEQQ